MANKLKQVIMLAQRHEAINHSMERFLAGKQARMHRAIRVSNDEKLNALLTFVVQYIEILPTIAEKAVFCAKVTHVEAIICPFIAAAEQFFFMPLAELKHADDSLPAVFENAYLAHRLFEEVNDYFIDAIGRPLIPFDLTSVNIIAHDLIGEPYANELDIMAADFTLKLPCIKSKHIQASFIEQVNKEKARGNWDKVWSNWQINNPMNHGLSLALNG